MLAEGEEVLPMTNMQSGGPQAADEAAISAILRQLVDAWNRGDGSAYGSLFTVDADYVDVTGTHTIGAAAIGSLHQFLFDGPLKGSQLEFTSAGQHQAAGRREPDISFLAPDVALVIGRGETRLAGQAQPAEDRTSINTTILVKRADGWRVRAFQNNRVQRRPGPRS